MRWNFSLWSRVEMRRALASGVLAMNTFYVGVKILISAALIWYFNGRCFIWHVTNSFNPSNSGSSSSPQPWLGVERASQSHKFINQNLCFLRISSGCRLMDQVDCMLWDWLVTRCVSLFTPTRDVGNKHHIRTIYLRTRFLCQPFSNSSPKWSNYDPWLIVRWFWKYLVWGEWPSLIL